MTKDICFALSRYEEIIQSISEKALSYFFITGMARSGTTWINNLLKFHPQIAMAEREGWLMIHLFNVFGQAKDTFNEKARYSFYNFTREDIRLMVRFFTEHIFFDLAKSKPGARVAGEKTPQGNSTMPRILEVFPDARIIQIIRDGRDVVVSNWFLSFNAANQDSLMGLSRDLGFDLNHLAPDEIPDEYVRFQIRNWNRAMLNKKKEEHRLHDDNYCEIKYEDLHRRPEQILRQVLLYLDVDANEKIIHNMIQANQFKRISGGRERGEEVRNAMYRKGVIGDWKNFLKPEQEIIIEEEAGEMLRRYGYN